MTETTWSQLVLFFLVLALAMTYFGSIGFALVWHRVLHFLGRPYMASRLVEATYRCQDWLIFLLVVTSLAYFAALLLHL